MSVLSLSQWQFAITTIYHFFFVPLTLGLSVLVAIMESLYVRTGDESYRRMTQFWGKLFLINFAMGVVTGIVEEFQFGMNWSQYSRFVGDIFGAPLAIEALLAFFLESTFLGVWIFGWEKLSKKLHLTTIWLVAIGSNLSALWILIANSFMQNPVGFSVENGRAVLTDFSAVIFNPNIFTQFPHVVLAGFTTGAAFVLGISAYHLFRKNQVEVFKRSFQVAAVFGAIAVVLLILVGHTQGQTMVRNQPMKMASAEALWQTQSPASFSLLTIGDLTGRKDVFSIRIPDLLSLLAYNQFSGEVKGINDLQAEYTAKYGAGDYIPPVPVIYWSFRLMVGAGFLLLAVAVFALVQSMRGKIPTGKSWVLRGMTYAIALPYLANSTGWMMTELGRQPWVVFGLMKTADAVSPNLTAGMVWISLIGFTLVYGALMAADGYLLFKYAKLGVEMPPAETAGPAKRKVKK